MSKRRSNNEGNIRLRADGRYEVRITENQNFKNGTPKRISRYASTMEEAVRILNELSFINDSRPNSFEKVTLGQWLDMCLEVYMRNGLKQATYISYEGYIRNHLKPLLGQIYLQELTPRTLQAFYNYKATDEGLSPKTIVNINLFLHRALDFAVAEGYINNNPASSVNLPRGTKAPIEILTRDEQNALFQASFRHRYGCFIRMTLFTGLRIGELLGLRWEDVDTQRQLLHIRRTLSRLSKMERPTNPNESTTEIVLQTPKSQNSLRTIPLLPQVLQDLQMWRAVQQSDRFDAGAAYIDSGMIVTNPLGGFIEPRTFKDYYNKMLADAGLRHFTFHALRHTFASRAIEQGMDPKTLSVILGHASVGFTLDTYAHVLNEHKQESMALMGDLFVSPQPIANEQPYPILVTFRTDGFVEITIPNFPEVNYFGTDINQGLTDIRERIGEELLTCLSPPAPTPIDQIVVGAGQQILWVTPMS